MKKGDVIQLMVIILALIAGFNAFHSFIDMLINISYMLIIKDLGSDILPPVIITLLITLVKSLFCWLLLQKSAKIADFIYEKTGMGTTFNIVSRPADLLYILLIITGFYFLLQHIPVLIKGLVNAFRSKATNRIDVLGYDSPIDWTITFIKILVPAVLLMAAKPIANYFAKNVREQPIEASNDVDSIGKDETINE